MTAELAQIKTQLARIETQQADILRMLQGKPAAHLTVRAFAKAIGRSESYVYRELLSTGRIRKERGRIPQTELRKFTS